MSPLVLEIIWALAAIVAIFVYRRLRHRSAERAADADVATLDHDHPVRILARAHLRNNTLWIGAAVIALVLAISGVLRDAFALAWEVPGGIGVLTILVLLGTAVLTGILNDLDDAAVEKRLRASELLRGVGPHG